jgi:hypothetical protein
MTFIFVQYSPPILRRPRTSRFPRPVLLVGALVALVALIAGCGGGGDDDETTAAATTAPAGGGAGSAKAGVYVGEVGGSNHLIGLVTDGGTRVSGAFLCIPQGTSQWIKPAQFQDGKAALVARNGTVLGSAQFSGDTATGTINSGSFSAKLASGKAGLYRKTTGTSNEPGFSESGWVVLPDGNTCGSTNSITQDGGFQSQPETSSPQGQITDFSNPFPF